MKSTFFIHTLVLVGLVAAACNRNNQGDPQPPPAAPALVQPPPQITPPGLPIAPNPQTGLSDNSRRAVALVMGAPVTNTSFIVSNFSEDSGICRYESVGPNASSLLAVNPENMLYFSRVIDVVRGNRSYPGCRFHYAAALQFDFSSDAVLTATLSMMNETFRGTRIPYSWDQSRRELIISNFQMRSANNQSKIGDVIEVSGSQRRVYLDEERRAYPGFRVEWQPDVSTRGHANPQASFGASQMRLFGNLQFNFRRQIPSQTIQMGGSHASINVGSIHFDTLASGGSTYFLPIQGSIMNQANPQNPSVPQPPSPR